ncbi:hypothetical protein GQ53DRAFT_751749 [Thozetella sp. PMI_491]|nr:hypothetical protein GQ53DRAFT_751749 [Thozetella sp. PMI_491]
MAAAFLALAEGMGSRVGLRQDHTFTLYLAGCLVHALALARRLRGGSRRSMGSTNLARLAQASQALPSKAFFFTNTPTGGGRVLLDSAKLCQTLPLLDLPRRRSSPPPYVTRAYLFSASHVRVHTPARSSVIQIPPSFAGG